MTVLSQDLSGWPRIAAYLDQALDLNPREREIWLSELTTTQSELAGTLRDLLREREQLDAAGFLSGASPLASGVTLQNALQEMLQRRTGVESGDWLQKFSATPIPDLARFRQQGIAVDTVLGGYRLIREIGEGGMSSVWLAERVDGQLKRNVALKLPHADSKRLRLVEHFQTERDILATLTHPNIARIYDAGVGESGQPYLAMEYVEGTSLLRYCDANLLGLRERLQVFQQVLGAVKFAHAHLVIHRDLKPSNILVTAEGRVVLLDFGIAKLLSEDSRDEPQVTQLGMRALTPDYASPEQISGKPLATASDVYSLGVVLYELLTGERPYRPNRESPAALEESILAQDPQRPSHIAISATQATARDSTARKLSSALKGDLDTIALKSLKKSPSDRYASVEAFAQDIDNYLQSIPVTARPDSHWYRFNRFVTRHKLPVSAAAIAVLAIVGGGAAAIWQARTAAQERDRAVVMALRNKAINEFTDMLIAEAAASEEPVTVSDMLARSEKLALSANSGDAENRAAILQMIAARYYSLGEPDKAAHLQEQALAFLDNSSDSGLRSHLVCEHALVISNLGQFDAAIKAIDRELGNPKADPLSEIRCLEDRSYIASLSGDAEGGVRFATLALQRFHELPRTELISENALLMALGYSYQVYGDNGQANHYFELALNEFRAAGRERSPDAISARSNWAMVSTSAGVPRRALELYDQNTSIESERAGTRPTAATTYNRARALELLGRFTEAKAAYELAYHLSSRSKTTIGQALSLLGLASIAEESGEAAVATRYLAQFRELFGTSLPAGNAVQMKYDLVQARLDLGAGKFADAGQIFDLLLDNNKRNQNEITAKLGKAEISLHSGDASAALNDAQAALNIAKALQGDLPYSCHAGLSWLMLGRVLQKQKNVSQAHTAFETAVDNLANTVDASHPALVEARRRLKDTA